MTDETKLTTYIVHGVTTGEWEPADKDYRDVEHVVQATGFDLEHNYRGERLVVVFKDAQGTVGAFATWDYFEREGGVAVRDVPKAKKDTKPEAPKHR